MPDEKRQFAGLLLKLSTTAATGLAVIFVRDAIVSISAARTELMAFNIRCSVGLAHLLKLSSRSRLAAVQTGLVLYHVQRIALFYGLNSMAALYILADLARLVSAGFRSVSGNK